LTLDFSARTVSKFDKKMDLNVNKTKDVIHITDNVKHTPLSLKQSWRDVLERMAFKTNVEFKNYVKL